MKLSEHLKIISQKPQDNDGHIYWVAKELFETAIMGNNQIFLPTYRMKFQVQQWLKKEGFEYEKSDLPERQNEYLIKF